MEFKEHPVEWTPAKIDRFWNFISRNTSLSNQFFALQVGDHVAQLLNKHISLKKQHKILDLSCGKGDIIHSLLPFMKTGQEIYGTDFAKDNVQHVEQRFQSNPYFQKAELVQKYPSSFSENFFDLIILTEVVEHLGDDDLAGVLQESHRLLKPGGFLCITTPNQEDLDASKVMCPDCGCIFHRWQHMRDWSCSSLAQCVEQYSLSTQVSQTVAWGRSWKVRMALNLAVWLGLKNPHGIFFLGKKNSL